MKPEEINRLEIRMKDAKEVADLYSEIAFKCSLKEPKNGLYIAVFKANYDTEAKGYTLRFYFEVDDQTLNCIKPIVEKHKLKYRRITDKKQRVLEIYTPRKS